MGAFKACVAAILALATGPLAERAFTRRVPDPVPSFQGWERIAGDVEIETPRISIQYEFFVNPERPATYEVVRYRVIERDPAENRRYPTTEKLQWDRNGRDVRRFECVAAGDGCTWRELEKGSKEYLLEVPVILWIYGLHSRVDGDRAQGPQEHHLAAPRRIVLPRVVG